MRLRAEGEQTVTVSDLAIRIGFTDGEEMRTEISAKFGPEGVRGVLAAAGFELEEWWTDPDGDFGVSLSAADRSPRAGVAQPADMSPSPPAAPTPTLATPPTPMSATFCRSHTSMAR